MSEEARERCGARAADEELDVRLRQTVTHTSADGQGVTTDHFRAHNKVVSRTIATLPVPVAPFGLRTHCRSSARFSDAARLSL